MNPAFSVIFFTVLSGAGYGLWFWTVVGAPLLGEGKHPGLLLVMNLVIGFLMVTVGLLSSVLHLGKPARAWRAFSQWRTSWLSREGVMAIATFLPAMYLAGVFFGWLPSGNVPLAVAGILLAIGSVTTVLCTAMIYASLKPIPAWRHRVVVPVYLIFALQTGGWITAFDCADEPGRMHLVVIGVCSLATLALAAMKLAYWRDIDRIELPSREAATGLEGIGKVTVFERPHTEANYLTREMGFVLARKHSRKLRAIALLLFAGVPLLALALAWMLPVTAVFALWIAALSALLGAFVERWLFFAEAKHMVMLYY
jgi:DMSO reductase anchor subunit